MKTTRPRRNPNNWISDETKGIYQTKGPDQSRSSQTFQPTGRSTRDYQVLEQIQRG